jgi:hypothetical protein
MTMSKESPKQEGLVKKILSEGDLADQEIKEKLWEKNVSFVRSYDRAFWTSRLQKGSTGYHAIHSSLCYLFQAWAFRLL